MDLNGVNSTYASASETVQTSAAKTKKGDTTSTTASKTSAYSDTAATYEASDKAATKTTTNISSKSDRSAIIAQLKADADSRLSQMQSLVTKMFQKQGVTIASTDDMWKALAGGNFTADPATIAQAKEDISENGYWGVNQTSERIFSFAQALSGGDDKKMQEMVKAVKKGFEQATAAWGQKLPQISSDTWTAVMDKFDNWFSENGSTATTEDLLK